MLVFDANSLFENLILSLAQHWLAVCDQNFLKESWAQPFYSRVLQTKSSSLLSLVSVWSKFLLLLCSLVSIQFFV